MILTSTLLHAQIQDFDPEFYFERSISIQKTGMIILGSWATLNIISGTAGYYLSEGDTRYFHQMNAYIRLMKNGLNLSLASIY